MIKMICPNCKTSFQTAFDDEANVFLPLTRKEKAGTYVLVPETIRNENKGENTMNVNEINFKGMTNEQKNEVLKAMGFNPFDFTTQTVDKTDPVVQEMYENGYVKNEKLHRRWITAQTMRLLGWSTGVQKLTTYWGTTAHQDSWAENVNNKYNWHYIFRQLLNEINAIQHLPEDSPRRIFFSENNISYIFDEYIERVEKYVKTLERKNCKGVPYVTLSGKNIFVDDIQSKVINPLKRHSARLNCDYHSLQNGIKALLKSPYYVKLPKTTSLSRTWIECFKASGAYYTMENLVKYSGLKLVNYETKQMLDRESSLKYLQSCKNNEGYQLLALLKESLFKNDFKFSEVIK
jgi:hypothetical protein